MPFDAELAARIRVVLSRRGPVQEKKMFGGLAFLRAGRMICGVLGQELVLRVGAEAYPGALRQRGVRKMDFSGRLMKGWVMVTPEACKTRAEVECWLRCAQPAEKSKPKKRESRL